MATHPKPIGVALLAVILSLSVLVAQRDAPQRIISVVPSVTDMLFAIGAGGQVVGVGSFDRVPSTRGATEIARVGGLLDPDMERILTLRPDLVVLYTSQTDAHEQLDRAGVPVFPYAHGGLDGIVRSLRDLGTLTGHVQEADSVARRLDSGLAAIRARVADLDRPRTLLVFGREPLAMRNVYASGGIGFLHEMLDVAGGENVFKDVRSENVSQVSSEAILTAAPDVIIEIRYQGSLSPEMVDRERAVWERFSTVPATRTGRIYFLTGNHYVVPGPRVLEATQELARLLHPEAF